MSTPKKVTVPAGAAQPGAAPGAKRKTDEQPSPIAEKKNATAQPGTASGAKRKAESDEQPSEQAEKKNATVPVRPGPNTRDEDLEAYYEDISTFVLQRLPGTMTQLGVKVQALQSTPPTTIAHNTKPAIGGAKLTTFREVWDIVNCASSMKTNGKYEAAGVLWWFALCGQEVTFESKPIFKSGVKRLALDAAAVHWSEATYVASDQAEHRRFFTFPGTMPTACSGLPDVEKSVAHVVEGVTKKAPIFKGLPMLAGRPVVLAYFEALVEAMQQGQSERLKKLFEATAPTPSTIKNVGPYHFFPNYRDPQIKRFYPHDSKDTLAVRNNFLANQSQCWPQTFGTPNISA